MLIKREFTHKTFGSIGSITMTATGEGDKINLVLNDKVMPVGSVEYLLNFALQSMQDSYASAKSETEAKAMWDKRWERLVEGKIGVREGSGVSDAVKAQRYVVGIVLKAKLSAEDYKAKVSGLEDAARNAFLDSVWEKNAAKLQPEVDKRLAELEAARKAKAAMAEGMDLDI